MGPIVQKLFINYSFGNIVQHLSVNDIKYNENFWRSHLRLLVDAKERETKMAMAKSLKYYVLHPMEKVYCSPGDGIVLNSGNNNNYIIDKISSLSPINSNSSQSDSWILYTEINKLISEQNNNDLSQLEILLFGIGEIGSFVNGEFLLAILLILVEHLLNNEKIIRGIAFDQIRKIAKFKGLSVKQLAKDHCDRIDTFLLTKLQNPTLVDEAASALYD